MVGLVGLPKSRSLDTERPDYLRVVQSDLVGLVVSGFRTISIDGKGATAPLVSAATT